MSKKAEGFSLRFVLINTGNISRKVLSKVLRSFDKNFERLQRRPDACGMYCNVIERKVMKKSTEKYNPAIYSMSSDRPDSLKQREIHFLNGSTAKMQAGYFSVTEDTRGKGGYNIYYYCDECLSDNDSVKNKHLDTCATTFL